MLFLLLRARFLIVVGISALVGIPMPEVVLIACEALLVLCLLDEVIDDVLVVLQLVELILFKVNGD